jgi:flagellar basal body rod protein FlgC
VKAELFHADMTKLRVASRNFANAPKTTQEQNATQGIPTRSSAVQVITTQAHTIRDADMPSNAFVMIVLDTFAYSQKAPFLSSCTSVGSHASVQLPVGGFS